jgi:hypothetical protein
MSTTGRSRIVDWPDTEATLHDLCKPFLPAGRDLCPECLVVQPDQIPFPQDQLLVHHEHMTVVLEKHHGAPVEVSVLAEHLDGDFYTRKISLAPRGSPGKVVELGIVQMDFRYMAPEVRDEILAKQLPLGAVLIKHDVLRRIKPRWFLRFPPDGPVMGLFGPQPQPAPEPVYGRIGTIYCNEEPAIELLEIVLNCGPSGPDAGGNGERIP